MSCACTVHPAGGKSLHLLSSFWAQPGLLKPECMLQKIQQKPANILCRPCFPVSSRRPGIALFALHECAAKRNFSDGIPVHKNASTKQNRLLSHTPCAQPAFLCRSGGGQSAHPGRNISCGFHLPPDFRQVDTGLPSVAAAVQHLLTRELMLRKQNLLTGDVKRLSPAEVA